MVLCDIVFLWDMSFVIRRFSPWVWHKAQSDLEHMEMKGRCINLCYSAA